MSHSARARPALALLAETDPALAALALWCVHRDTGGSTQTHGDTIHYGPDFANLPPQEQMGVAAHHVLHVALRHAPRAAALAERLGDRFDLDLYGLAADAVVNETLLLAGQALPRPCPRLTELLSHLNMPAPGPHEALTDWDVDRLAMRLHRDSQSGRAARDYGQKKSFVRDLSPEGQDSTQAAADWHGHVLRAFDSGRQAGEGIGLLGGLIADLNPSRVPWERHLRRLLTRALSAYPKPSHRRPSSAWVATEALARAQARPVPVFQPGRQRMSERPRIVVGIDTSASIDALTLDLFFAETLGVARRTGAETHMMAFDETVHMARLLPPDLRSLPETPEMRSGGGTSFVDVLAQASALKPSIIVVLTDLEGPFGPAPQSAVLWATPVTPHVAPPFGRVLQMDTA